MRFVVILLFVAAALLWGGIQGIYTYLANPEPLHTSCADYAAQRPEAEWVALSDCVPSVLEAISLGFGGRVDELYVPLFAPDAPEEARAVVLMATSDATTVELFNELLAHEEAADGIDAEAAAALLDRLATANRPRQVSGVVQFGIELDDDDREQVAKHVERAAADFVILSDGAQPAIAWPVTATGLGLAAAVAALALVRRARQAK